MQVQRATGIPQVFVLNHRVGRHARVSNKERGAASAVPSLCAPAFLTTKIEPKRPDSKSLSGRFSINLDKSYANVLACCKRFLKYVGIDFEFRPSVKSTKIQALAELTDYFEKTIEPLGLSLVVSKHDCRGDDVDVLECVVYRHGKELDSLVVIMYCAPARYMSASGGQMYKRFMKFVSESMGIPLGTIGNTDNYYLDCIIESYEDYECYEDDEEKVISEEDKIREKYKEGGEFWNLFDEIESLPKESAKDLYEALEEYRHICPVDELDLIEVMMEGIDIVKDADRYWFEFNPDDDGMDGIFDSNYSSSVLTSAILYSENDGITNALLDMLNQESNCGVEITGWNIHQWLSTKMKKSDILKFMRCKDLVSSLSEWTTKFYYASEKFDLYGKFEQDTK